MHALSAFRNRIIIILVTGLFIASCNSGGGDGLVLFAPGYADPALQNGVGGSGAAINTPIAGAFVLFQQNWVSKLVNRDGGAIQKNGVDAIYSFGIYADPNAGGKLKLLVNDRGNHRILIFNSIPRDATAQPDVVVGQGDFVSGAIDAGGAGVSALGFNESVHVSVCTNGMMFVADRNNNRVLGYNSVPTTNGVAANFVIGQTDMISSAAGTTANLLTTPYAAYCVGNKLFLIDKGNNRILVYDPIPTTTNPAPSFIIGQPDFITGTANCSSIGLNSPYEILLHNGMLFIADGGNHRVLVFNSIPTATGAAADAVLGQTNMTSCLRNQINSATPAANSLYWPNSLAAKDNMLAISDHSNYRVVFFTLPATTNQSAFWQYGQPDFTTSTPVDPPTANSVGRTKGLVFDQSYMWIVDTANKRVVVVNPF